MDWSEPHDFGRDERATLEGLALAVGLAVCSFGGGANGSVAAKPAESRPAGMGPADDVSAEEVACVAARYPTAEFHVKASGALAPAAPVPWGGASVANVSVAWRGEPVDHAAAFWDVFPYGEDGSIAVVLGAIESSTEGAPAQAALARAALRSAVEQALDVESVLATLGKRVSGDCPGVSWTSATVALLEGKGTVLESHFGGEAFVATLRSDGRVVIEEPSAVPLGATVLTALSSGTGLLLCGDRVVLSCGGSGASEGAVADRVRGALSKPDDRDGIWVAERVLDLGPADGRPAVVAVIDVLDRVEDPR
jgi:hypothetical protein